jgi:hypothetical protein
MQHKYCLFYRVPEKSKFLSIDAVSNCTIRDSYPAQGQDKTGISVSWDVLFSVHPSQSNVATNISAVLFVTTVKRVLCRTASPRKIAQRTGKIVVIWQQRWPTPMASSVFEGLKETNSDRTHKIAP